MDLTTLVVAAFMMISAIGFDTALHPRDIVLEATKSDQIGKVHVTDDMLNAVLNAQVDAIFLTPSVVSKPAIRTTHKKGIGLSITDAFGLSQVADALQEQAGYAPDRIRLYVFSENDTAKVLVSGFEAQNSNSFQQEVVQVQDESIVSLVQRATSVGVAYIDPYMTALNLMRRHIKDRDFKLSQEVMDFAKARLPTTAASADRSMLENLEGMIALFNSDVPQALQRFQRAVNSNPANHVAILNLALTEIALDMDAPAEAQLTGMLKTTPPTDRVVLTTAYVTLAGAYLGLHQPARADAAMQQASDLDPNSPTVLGIWAEVKLERGDTDAAGKLADRARLADNPYEEYAEIAALYFTWQKGQPFLRSPSGSATKAQDTTEKTAPTAPETAKKAAPPVPDAVAKPTQ